MTKFCTTIPIDPAILLPQQVVMNCSKNGSLIPGCTTLQVARQGAKEEATTALLNYLLQNNLIGVEITPEQVDFVIQEICRIITIYGRHELGFDRGNPQSLGPALRRFNMECTDTSHHNRNKIITLKRCP